MNKPITVAELIAQLKELPPDAWVETEGCDCMGPCSGAEFHTGGLWSDGRPRVVLCRLRDQ